MVKVLAFRPFLLHKNKEVSFSVSICHTRYAFESGFRQTTVFYEYFNFYPIFFRVGRDINGCL